MSRNRKFLLTDKWNCPVYAIHFQDYGYQYLSKNSDFSLCNLTWRAALSVADNLQLIGLWDWWATHKAGADQKTTRFEVHFLDPYYVTGVQCPLGQDTVCYLTQMDLTRYGFAKPEAFVEEYQMFEAEIKVRAYRWAL